jgi:hypothetical protein
MVVRFIRYIRRYRDTATFLSFLVCFRKYVSLYYAVAVRGGSFSPLLSQGKGKGSLVVSVGKEEVIGPNSKSKKFIQVLNYSAQ